MATAEGTMVMRQLPIQKFKTKNKKGESFVTGGLTSRRGAQMDGTVHV